MTAPPAGPVTDGDGDGSDGGNWKLQRLMQAVPHASPWACVGSSTRGAQRGIDGVHGV